MLRKLTVVLLLAPCAWAASWYVRMDGGTAAQCTGVVDAAYPGTGVARPCAFINPFYLWTNDPPKTLGGETPKWKIAGGDTVIIKNGDFKMGYKTPDANGWWNYLGCRGNMRACMNPPIPPGTADNPTRIVGEQWQSGCKVKSILRGGGATNAILSLFDTHDVELDCLDITDNAQCRIFTVTGEPYACVYTVSDMAYLGLQTNQNTHHVALRNLFIHGIAGAGIAGAVGGNIVAENIHLRGNGNMGWNFDPGAGQISHGPLVIKNSVIEWSACVERFPLADPVILACYDQDGANANGDGLGFVDFDGDVLIDHDIVRYNQQDGLDALYLKSAKNVIVTNSQFYGNEGQQIKTGGSANMIVRNNLIVGNCWRQKEAVAGVTAPDYNLYQKSHCRASDFTALVFNKGSSLAFENNSMVTYHPTAFDIQCTAITDIINAAGRKSVDGSVDASVKPDGVRRTFTLAYPITGTYMSGGVYVHPPTGSRVAKRFGRTGIDTLCGTLPCQYWYTVGSAEITQDAAEPTLPANWELRVSYWNPALCADAKMSFANNVTRGYQRIGWSELPGSFWFANLADGSPLSAPETRLNNVYCGIKPGFKPGPTETFTQVCPGTYFANEPPTAITTEAQLDNFDFHPAAASPLLDAGVALPAVTVDYDGKVRPSGAAWDIGAYEVQPATPPPSGVMTLRVVR